MVRKALQADAGIKAVLLTHNETSTGVTNDLAALTGVAREFDKLILVDAISSLGSINLPVDAWGCDFVATGSQKGWMTPPGLAMVSVSPKGWQAYEKAKMPRYYFDVGKAKKYLEKNQTPWTPAVSIVFGLAVGLDNLAKEGLPNLVARHRKVAQRARDHVKALGLKLFPADESYASNTVTAIVGPEGVDVKKLLQILREEHSRCWPEARKLTARSSHRAPGLGIGEDMDEVANALKAALPKVGFKEQEQGLPVSAGYSSEVLQVTMISDAEVSKGRQFVCLSHTSERPKALGVNLK